MEEVITTPEVVEKTPEDTQPDQKEKTVGEVLNTTPQAPKEKETVGLDKFLEIKKENKQLVKSLKELEEIVKGGGTKEEISDDISQLAEEFDIDPKFLSKLEKTLRVKSEREIEDRMRPITEKENQARIDTLFKAGFEKAMSDMPEFAQIVNPNVIKQLSLNPANGNKTFSQLIEETYGHAVGGKSTIESVKSTGRGEPNKLDYQKAVKDSEYFKEVMNNPELKKEYNAQMLKQGY